MTVQWGTSGLPDVGTAGVYEILQTDAKGRGIAGWNRTFDVTAHYGGSLANAVAAAVSASAGVVQLSAGVNTLSAEVTLGGSNIWIRGMGPNVTILRAAAASTFARMLYATGRTNLILSDLTIDCNGVNRTAATNTLEGVRFEGGCDDALFLNVRFMGSLGLAAGPVSSDVVTVTGNRGRFGLCQFRDCGTATRPSDGFYLVGNDHEIIAPQGKAVTDTVVALINCNRANLRGLNAETVGCGFALAVSDGNDYTGNIVSDVTVQDGSATTHGVAQLVTLSGSTGNIIGSQLRNITLRNASDGPALAILHHGTGTFQRTTVDAEIVGAQTQAVLIEGGSGYDLTIRASGADANTVQLNGTTDVTVRGRIEADVTSGCAVYCIDTTRTTVDAEMVGDGSLALNGVFFDGDNVDARVTSEAMERCRGFTAGPIGRAATGALSLVVPGVRVVKSTDEAKTTDTTLATDDELQFPMLRGLTYWVEGKVAYTTSNTPNFKYALAGPASPSLLAIETATHAPDATLGNQRIESAYGVSRSVSAATGTQGSLTFAGTVHNGANGGTFGVQWAQDTSDAGATTVRKGSTLHWGIG